MSTATLEAMPTLTTETTTLGKINPTQITGNKQWSTYLSKMDGVVSKNMFEMFGPGEVVDRMKRSRPDIANQPVTVVRANDKILTVNKEGFTPIQPRAVATRALDLFPDAKVSYSNGAVTITDKMDMPHMGIGGEGFAPMWNIKYHSDGYGKNAWTAFLMRLVCSNGMMMRDALTSAHMNIGNGASAEDKLDTLSRLMVSAQQPDKAYALVDRVSEIQNVFASVREINDLKNAAFADGKVSDNANVNAWTSNWLFDMPTEAFKMSGAKAARTATNVPLYDVLNLSSEIASHCENSKMTLKMGELTSKILKKGPDLCEAIGKHDITDYRDTFLKEGDLKDARKHSDDVINKWLALTEA